jgi:hypothetical protein
MRRNSDMMVIVFAVLVVYLLIRVIHLSKSFDQLYMDCYEYDTSTERRIMDLREEMSRRDEEYIRIITRDRDLDADSLRQRFRSRFGE